MRTNTKKRLLLTGAGGFLGWNICHCPQQEWEIIGCVHVRTPQLPGVITVKADLTDSAALRALFREARPDAVIHAAAIADPNTCQLNAGDARRVNVDASIAIAELCADAAIPCVFTSTDLVFDGRNPPYNEDAEPCPVNCYGEQKALAEKEMRRRWPRVSVCRLPLMFGASGPLGRNHLFGLVQALREGRQVRLFTDEIRSTADAADVASGLFLALQEQPPLLHLGGPEPVSRYAFGIAVARIIGAPAALLLPTRQAEVTMPAPRPPDVTFDNSRAFALGYRPARIAAALHRLLADQARHDEPTGHRASGR